MKFQVTEKKVWLTIYSHKHGLDIAAYESLEAAIAGAEDIRQEWWPDSEKYSSICEDSDGDESVEIEEKEVWGATDEKL